MGQADGGRMPLHDGNGTVGRRFANDWPTSRFWRNAPAANGRLASYNGGNARHTLWLWAMPHDRLIEPDQGKGRYAADLPAGSAGYRVGDLIVDTGRGRVTRGDVEVPLPKLSFDLLLALIHVAPNLLTLDLMMERVWPGLVVSPETVTQRVKVLRQSLGDDAKNPRYITGVRGRGYRIVADVASLGAPLPPSVSILPSGPTAAPAHRWSRRRWMGLVAASVLVMSVIATAVWHQKNAAPPAEIAIQGRALTVSSAPPRSVAVLPFDNLSTGPDGAVFALGIAEQVLHQLGKLSDLTVIARTSSFAFQGHNTDARDIGRKLNTKFLLEGSVQRDGQRLRVTAELVDADTDLQVWSARFDRAANDIFAVQDEIALEVAQALEVNISAAAREKLAGRSTQNLDAWLAYEQGRALMATRKLADLQNATKRFADASRLDPSFAAAYVSQAEARLLTAFFQGSDVWFGLEPALAPAERIEIDRLLAQALKLDPRDGEAYIVHGWLREGGETGNQLEAEADDRRGLALSPNSELGYERLARVLFFYPKSGERYDPEKREESYVMIDKARSLDPLAPTAHLTKAELVLFGRGDRTQAKRLLLQALQVDPNNYPALVNLGGVEWLFGNFAEAVRYGEQALTLEPRAFWPRTFLLRYYLDLEDAAAAREIINLIPPKETWSRIPWYLYQRDWRSAGELANVLPLTLQPIDLHSQIWALLHAGLAAGQLKLAIAGVASDCSVPWNRAGEPVVARSNDSCVELAMLMQAAGERDRAARLLRAEVSATDRELRDQPGGERWDDSVRPEALALLGDREGAINALQQVQASTSAEWWYRLQLDPALDGIRHDPRLEVMLTQARTHAAEERAKLQELRAQGLVPERGSTTTTTVSSH
jgi:TolB-like protein/DNA-binding winged helix-turn-helix (wHTH) protein